MLYATKGAGFAAVDRVIVLGLVVSLLAGCSDDTTSPAAVATGIVILSGASQTAAVNTATAAPVVVRVTDQSGNSMVGAVVTFTAAASSGTVSAAQVTTDANGAAQVAWTLGTIAGADSLNASIGSASVVIVATAAAGAPAAITVLSGNDQSAPAGTALSTLLAVKVTDQYGNAVPNASVQWSDDANGVLSTSTTVTDANGVAQDAYTLGPAAGVVDDVMATVVVNGAPLSSAFVEDAM